MLTNTTFKVYAGQIANLFCKSDLLCRQSVKDRIVSMFDDQTFNSFIQGLPSKRFYVVNKVLSSVRSGTNYTVKIQVTDIVTGSSSSVIIQGVPITYLNPMNWKLVLEKIQSFSFLKIVDGLPVFSSVTTPYGIVFVPGQIGSGQGQITPVEPVPVPGSQPVVTKGSLPKIPEWIIPVAIAIGGYFVVRKFL